MVPPDQKGRTARTLSSCYVLISPYASTALVRPGPDPSQFMATLFESAASMPARPSPASRPRKSDAIESKRLLNWPFDGIHIEPPKFSMPVRTSDGHFLARGLPRAGHYLCAFQSKHRSLSTSHSEPAMPIVKARACTILGEFEQAQRSLSARP